MNPFQRLGAKISNWWKGEPQDSGGKTTLNSPSFLERIGLKRKGKPTSEVTYFTCLKMLSETLAKMPIKYYQKTDNMHFYKLRNVSFEDGSITGTLTFKQPLEVGSDGKLTKWSTATLEFKRGILVSGTWSNG